MPKSPKALLITDKSNIRYLSNFTGSSGFMLINGKNSYLFTDFRYLERAKRNIKKGIKLIDCTKMWRNPEILKKNWQNILRKHKIRKLGIEEDNLTISQFKKFQKISPKVKFQNISGTIEKAREIKNPKEIALITKSQRINEKIFLAIKKIIQTKGAKIREKDLFWKIKELAHQFGAEDLSFDPIIAFGKNSAIPHHESGETLLKKGDLVLIDMGVKYQGYCSDMTRTIFTTTPSHKQKEIYNLVLTAQKTAIKQIRAGLSGTKIDSFSRKIIEKAGYGENYGHAGGHGIGLDIHEIPSLSEHYKKPIAENTVITVEPGIYLPGEFGVRIEDMVLVKKTGNRNLTKIKKEI